MSEAAERQRLPRSAFRLRPVAADDCRTVFDLRNADTVRAGMFTREPLEWDSHRRWFERMLVDEGQRFVLLEAEGEPIGVVGFYGLSNPHARGEWTIYVGKPGAPKAAGTILAAMALDHYFGPLGRRRLTAEVLADNPASLALHRKAHFREEGRLLEHSVVERRPTDVVVFGMLHRDWVDARDVVYAGLFL